MPPPHLNAADPGDVWRSCQKMRERQMPWFSKKIGVAQTRDTAQGQARAADVTGEGGCADIRVGRRARDRRAGQGYTT